ncbi:MAG TPA: FkbM family methyltransferase [Gemmatimonadales bacterium]|jgi:FkbM family methyltransferase|nr:FkbM family methyltransferase [Gemmatimonadales bacterium]
MTAFIDALKRGMKWLIGRDLYRKPERVVATERLGDPGGRWTLATDGLRPGTVVYSFGIGEDISFERDLIQRYGVRVHAFDPTPLALRYVAGQNLPDGLVVHPYGVADYDGTARFDAPIKGYISFSTVRGGGSGAAVEAPVRRVTTLQKDLNLPAPDILKMDIEGAEYAVLDDAIASGFRPMQILVEFHHRYRETGARKTREAIALLNRAGYRIVFVHPKGMEYTFLRDA